MEVAKLGLIFCIIVVIIWLKYPLYLAMTAGILGAILLFQIPVTEALLLLGRQTIAWETIDLLLSFYVIIFLQLMMEKKGRLKNARDSFDHLLRNRRLNTIISPAIMGLGRELMALVRNLLTLILVLAIIVGNIPATFAGAFVILLNYFVDHFRKSDLKDLIVRSAEPVLLGKMCSSS